MCSNGNPGVYRRRTALADERQRRQAVECSGCPRIIFNRVFCLLLLPVALFDQQTHRSADADSHTAQMMTQGHCDVMPSQLGVAAPGTGGRPGRGESKDRRGWRRRGEEEVSCKLLEHKWLLWLVGWCFWWGLSLKKKGTPGMALNSYRGSLVSCPPWLCPLLPKGAEGEYRVW